MLSKSVQVYASEAVDSIILLDTIFIYASEQ